MTERPGLYIMVFLAMVGSCSAMDNSSDTLKKVNALEKRIEELQTTLPKIQTGNVLAGPEDETFYDLNGQRVYLTVDGKPVESYFAK